MENPLHIQSLIDQKSLARRGRGLRRLTHAAPNAEKLLATAAERGSNIGSMTAGLLAVLDSVTPADLDLAIADVLERDMATLSAVRQALDQRRAQQGKPPAVLSRFSSNPRAAHVVVHTHRLESYDLLNKENES